MRCERRGATRGGAGLSVIETRIRLELSVLDPVVLSKMTEIFERGPQRADHAGDFLAVVLHLDFGRGGRFAASGQNFLLRGPGSSPQFFTR